MKSFIEAIKIRHSVRNYSNQATEKEKLRQLLEYFDSNRKGPLGSRVWFRIVDGSAYNKEELKELGTYGLIKGPRLFIAGTVNKNQYAMEDYGYCMEKNILLATSLGLGTCWLGGTLNRSTFAKILAISENEIIPAVTPVGYAGDKDSLVGRVTAMLVGAQKRKEAEELFFNGSINQPLVLKECGDLATVLECVRCAPSAGNRQPWRILKQEDAFHFYLKENPVYNNPNRFPGIKIQNIDMGIAMAHFDLAAEELGCKGKWQISEPGMNQNDFKYIVTWVGDAK